LKINAPRYWHKSPSNAAAKPAEQKWLPNISRTTKIQVNTARDLEFAINEHETAELAAIDEALARLSAGTYGHCIDCDATIPEARLSAAPEAARCIGCQEKTEHNHH
jgi:RNA polymerase-binding transcription factor DksA